MADRPKRRRYEGRPIEGRPNAKVMRIRKRFFQFDAALDRLNYHFDNGLLPREPEEVAMMRVILALQNILEYETELAIAAVASRSPKGRHDRFLKSIEEGYASFKSKFEWLLNKGLLSKTDTKVMEEIRKIRNEHAHWRPSATRRRLKYFGTPLLTSRAVKQILLDVQPIVANLRGISGSTEKLSVIPPGLYFD
jgi:hypothetical protein